MKILSQLRLLWSDSSILYQVDIEFARTPNLYPYTFRNLIYIVLFLLLPMDKSRLTTHRRKTLEMWELKAEFNEGCPYKISQCKPPQRIHHRETVKQQGQKMNMEVQNSILNESGSFLVYLSEISESHGWTRMCNVFSFLQIISQCCSRTFFSITWNRDVFIFMLNNTCFYFFK